MPRKPAAVPVPTPAPSGDVDRGRSRKIGEYPETIAIELSPAQVEEEKGKVCDLLARKANLLDAVASVKADYKAKVSRVDSDIARSLRAAASKRLELDVTIEEWLTGGNEVVRIRADTGEPLGRRTATAVELQETLFDEAALAPRGPAADDDDFPSGEEAFGDGTS